MGNLTRPMGVIGQIVRDSVIENFRAERSPEGVPWKKSLRAIIQGGITLVDTAVLRNSIHHRAYADRVEIGTPVKYAAVHQFGAGKGSFGTVEATVKAHVRRITKAFGKPIAPRDVTVKEHKRKTVLPWGDIPKRPFMGVKRTDWDEIRSSIIEHFMRGGR